MTFDAHAYVDAAAAAIGLPIAPEHRDAVAANVARLEALAWLVSDAPAGPASPTASTTE